MELQWPLILFTTLVAWSAGLFGTQSLATLLGRGERAQMPSLAASVVLLAVGGVAVFFHLEHWERIFNGFGHLTSGITQELIAIVAVVALMVACFALLRKGAVPKWLTAVSLAASVALIVVMAHSYTMPARPAWNSVLWILAVLGEACVLGPASFALISSRTAEDRTQPGGGMGFPAVIGGIVNALATIAFALHLQFSASSFAQVGYHFDPTHPANGPMDIAAIVGDQAPLLWIGAVVVGALAPLAACLVAKRGADGAAWKIWGSIALVATLAGAICLRVAFYNVGASVFMFY